MNSIFGRLLKLPDETLVFPAHDYKGDTVSTIGEEKRYNPRLQVRSVDEYVELMNNLKLPNPKMMDVAVPANMHVGLQQEDIARQGLGAVAPREAITASAARHPAGRFARGQRARQARHDLGRAACALPRHRRRLKPGGMLRELPPPPAAAWCSSAPSASARRWRWRPRRTRASPTPRISRAASTPGRRWAGRWFTVDP